MKSPTKVEGKNSGGSYYRWKDEYEIITKNCNNLGR